MIPSSSYQNMHNPADLGSWNKADFVHIQAYFVHFNLNILVV